MFHHRFHEIKKGHQPKKGHNGIWNNTAWSLVNSLNFLRLVWNGTKRLHKRSITKRMLIQRYIAHKNSLDLNEKSTLNYEHDFGDK